MFETRIKNIKKKLLEEKVDAILISSVSNIVYLTGFANFSKDEKEAYIFIGKDFGYIITDGRYSEAVKKQVSHLTLFERGHKNPMEHLFKKHKIKKLGIEEDNLTVSEHKVISKHFKNIKHFEISRSIKTKEEISKIEKACKLGDLVFEYILKKIKPGVSEKEIAFELEVFVKKNGADLSFPSIIAFGKNSSVPHHQTGNTILDKEQIVLLDFGIKFENYCSDMTRTVFFGKPSDKQKRIYETVLKAQQKTISAIKTGERKTAKLHKIADEYFKSCGFSAIPHSLGHGIGLEVHEHPSLSPKSKEALKEGMVFSIEPGVYIPEFGGVRIEDLFVLEKQSLRQLTSSSKSIISLQTR